MRLSGTLMLAALAATLLLLVAVGSASARDLSLNEQRFSLRWASLTWNTAVGSVRCPVTLRGSLHTRTFAKTSELLIGSITGATITSASCTNGRATILTGTLPWHLRYRSFTGTLPTITTVRLGLTGLNLQMSVSELTCLFSTEAAEPGVIAANVGASGEIRTMDFDNDEEIDLEDEDFLCLIGGDSSFSGSAAVDGDLVEPIVVRLIAGEPPANLRAEPSSVTIDELESSDRFTLINEGTGSASALIDRVEDEGADEFDVSGCGAGSSIRDAASCVYTVAVDERPLASGRVTVSYDDNGGIGSSRSVSIEVDVQGDDPLLRANPSEVIVEVEDQNDIVTVRNEADGAITITETEVITSDVLNPDFEATAPGCDGTLAPRENCSYIITVEDRPETEGQIDVTYRGSVSGELTLEIPVDIRGTDNEADLRATPESVSIERLETNDSFVLRNAGTGTATATIIRTELISDDRERPEFEVTGPGCGLIFIDEASCTYIVTVNSRPETDGRYVFEYEDGTGSIRRTTVEIDIAS
jgi:hypothetical protein